jgi:hypothetical protein
MVVGVAGAMTMMEKAERKTKQRVIHEKRVWE